MRATALAGDQGGVVLVVALLVLLLLGIIATTVARTNQLQLRMAGNDEARIAALQQALAGVDAILASAAGTPINGGVGYRICTPESSGESCDERTIALEADVQPTVGSLDAVVTRLAPLQGRLPIMGADRASSAVHYRVAKFEIQVAYEGIGPNSGRAVLAQGVLVRLPSSPQSGGGSP